MEIPCPLHEAAASMPAAPALTSPEGRWSFRELDQYVAGTAERLRAEGVAQGDRVALCLENEWRTVVLLLAVIRAGAVACPLSTRFPDALVQERIRAFGATLLICESAQSGAVPPDSLMAVGGARTSAIPADRPATIVCTSGSTGAARGVLHAYGHHIFSAEGSNENIPLGPGDRWLISLPLYHVGGLAILFRCLLARAEIVISDRIEGDVTHLSLVPTQLGRLLRDRRVVSQAWKAVLLGGGAVPPALLDESTARGLPVHTSYGLTEMASQVATTAPGASRDVLRSCGRVLPHRELRLDEDGRIHVRGRTRFLGYVDRYAGEDGIERPFDDAGWFATGDVGRFDDDGRLLVLGRLDNVFVSGGENIRPEEIEAVLETEVERAIVVPVDDPEFGRRPVAFVRSGVVDAVRLRAAVAEALPRFMVPDAFYAWPEGEEGLKIDRARLERLAADLRVGC